MTKHVSRRIMTDVLVVLVSVVMITIAVTFLGDPIRARIAASIPTPFDLAMVKTLATAEPSKLSLPRATELPASFRSSAMERRLAFPAARSSRMMWAC